MSNLKKSLYQAVVKAMEPKKEAVSAIIEDIRDSNDTAEVDPMKIPQNTQKVLHKDMSVSETHQMKQANAEAKLGKMPKAPAMPKPKMSAPATPSMKMAENEQPSKGIDKLKKFMEKCEMKKAEKGVHLADTPHGKGVSSAGMQARQNLPRPKQAAKQAHSDKLKELKGMPKPNLPKSEESNKK